MLWLKKKNPLVLTFQCVISDFLRLNTKIGLKKKQELFEDFEYYSSVHESLTMLHI